MTDKSAGIDFDRQVFVQPQQRTAAPQAARATGLIFVLVVLAAVVFLAYKLLPQFTSKDASTVAPVDASMVNLDKRLDAIETRLDRLEAARKVAFTGKKEQVDEKQTPPKPIVKTIYQVSPTPHQTTVSTVPDPAAMQRIAALQQRLGALQSDQSETREAWQATTDKLADMAGQVGSQGVEILKSQDELNQLLSRTEMEAIPFELIRKSNPQPVGPVSLVLKSSSPKAQRYTVCVYVQPSCIELKDRTLHEVVQFVVARNTSPLEMIATKIAKDEIVGYLEVPRDQSAH